jgi:L-asparaginase II
VGPTPSSGSYPDNPVLVRIWRGRHVESVHRGAWCLVDGAGRALAGEGSSEAPVFARSSIKPIQALPLLESGAAERFGFTSEDLAVMVSSHSGEACHTERVASVLRRLGLSESALLCGVHAPTDPQTRRELERAGLAPSALHNNCSGKHAGFLALALELGVPIESYLDPEGECQRRVRAALGDLAGVPQESLEAAVDGCSAPTYRVGLRPLATAFARVTTPTGLAPSRAQHLERLTRAVAGNPVLLAGSHARLDTDLVRASGGRLLAKIGAEAVYLVGVRGGDRALAVKIDDGGTRALFPLVIALLARFQLLTRAELETLADWRQETLRNHAGRVVGRVEPVVV